MMTSLAFIHPPGMYELIVIFLVALLIFGPKSLPKLGRALGQGLREFREATNRMTETLTNLPDEEEERQRRQKAERRHLASQPGESMDQPEADEPLKQPRDES